MKTSHDIYLQLRLIQERLDAHHRKYGDHLLVDDAVRMLYSEGVCSAGPVPEADFSSWDISDVQDLMRIYLDSYLEVSPLIDHPAMYSSVIPLEQLHFFSEDVWPQIALRNEAEHVHSQDCFNLHYVMSGKMTLMTGKDIYSLDQGSAALIAPNVAFGTFYPEDSVVFMLSIKKSTFRNAFSSILARDGAMASFFNNCLYGQLQNVLLLHRDPDEHLFSIIRQIFCEAFSSERYSSEICNSYVTVLLGELFRGFSSTEAYFSEDRSVHAKMPVVLSYIRDNMTSVTLSDTAAHFGYDTDYLGKVIHKSTGQYFKDIVNNYKVGRARGLLLYTEDSVEHIGEICGFSSPTHFSRTFKKYKGTTPARYRRDHASE